MRRPTSSRVEAAGLRWLGDGEGGARVPEVLAYVGRLPDPVVGRVGTAERRHRRGVRAHGWPRPMPAGARRSGRERTATSAPPRWRTRRPTRGRSSSRPGGYCRTCGSPGTEARSPPTTPPPIEQVVETIDVLRRAAGTAEPSARRPVERQRGVERGRSRGAGRPGRPWRSSRDRPGDAGAVRRPPPRPADGRVRRGVPARPTAGATGCRSTSCTRSWSTPRCSVARTARGPGMRRGRCWPLARLRS